MSHAVEIVEPSIELARDQNYKPRWMHSTLPSDASPTSKFSEEKIAPLMPGLFGIVKLFSCSKCPQIHIICFLDDVDSTWVRTFYLDYTIHVDILLKWFVFPDCSYKTSSKRVLVSFHSRWTAGTVPGVARSFLGIPHGFWCLLAVSKDILVLRKRASCQEFHGESWDILISQTIRHVGYSCIWRGVMSSFSPDQRFWTASWWVWEAQAWCVEDFLFVAGFAYSHYLQVKRLMVMSNLGLFQEWNSGAMNS